MENMEQNTFLLPESWSETIHMTTKDMSYRSYVGTRGSGRYMHFEVTEGKNKIDILVRGNDIEVSQSIFKKRLSENQIVGYIEDIYKEQHSFIDNAEGIKKLRAELRQNRASIKTLQENNKKLERQIADGLKITKKAE